MSASPPKKPWSMKWIALAIAVFVVGYTFITLHFRKPGQAYQPYRAAKDRAVVRRLETAGFQRAATLAELPADTRRSAANLTRSPAPVQIALGGLSAELAEALGDSKPQLPVDFTSVTAPATTKADAEYALQFTCTLPDRSLMFSETFLYVKEGRIALVAGFEHIPHDLQARNRESTVLVRIPRDTLKPGEYRVTLVGAHSSRQWTLQVH